MKISEEIYNKIINNNIIDLNENSYELFAKIKKKKREKDKYSKKNIRIEKKEKQLNDINNEIKSNDKNPLKNTILIDKEKLRSEKKPMIKKKQQFEKYYYINYKKQKKKKIKKIRQKKIDYLNETLKKKKKGKKFLINKLKNKNKKKKLKY